MRRKLLPGVQASELLMFENTPFTAVVTLLAPEMQSNAIKATSNAKSWPSSPFFRPWKFRCSLEAINWFRRERRIFLSACLFVAHASSG
jgi:hypothetical protein